MNFHETDFFAFSNHTFHSFFNDAAARTHRYQDAFRILSAHIVEQVVLTTRDFGEFVHFFLNNSGNCEIVRIARFTSLEVNVRVLSRTANEGFVRIQRAFTNLFDQFGIDHRFDFVFGHLIDTVDFVRNTETIVKMHERNASFKRCSVRNHRHILRFLNGTGNEHRPTSRTARHHIGMIAEDGERVSRHAARGHMEHAGGQFTSDFEHIRNHEEQALRRRKRTGQRTRLKSAVDGTRRTCFALHFHDLWNHTENIFYTFGGPFIRQFTQRRRWRNWINRHDFGTTMGNVRSGFVTVKRDKTFGIGHCKTLLKKISKQPVASCKQNTFIIILFYLLIARGGPEFSQYL